MKTRIITAAVVVAAMASFANAAFNWNEVRQQRQMMPNRPAWQQDYQRPESWQPGAGRFWGYNAPRMQQPYAMRQYPQQGRRGQFEARGFGTATPPQARKGYGGFNPQMRQRFGQDCPFGSCPYDGAITAPYQSRQNFPDAQKMRQMYQRRALQQQDESVSRNRHERQGRQFAPDWQQDRAQKRADSAFDKSGKCRKPAIDGRKEASADAVGKPSRQRFGKDNQSLQTHQPDRAARKARGGEQRQQAAPSSDELKTQLRQAIMQKDYDKAQRILGRLKEIDG